MGSPLIKGPFAHAEDCQQTTKGQEARRNDEVSVGHRSLRAAGRPGRED